VAEPEDLTLAYLAAHPADAAGVLEALPIAASAGLLGDVPARIAAPVLTAMRPPAAARLALALERDAALALLTGMTLQSTAAILRHVPEPSRSSLLKDLPTARAVVCRMLLGYPGDSVAACTETDVVALGPETPVAAALARLRDAPEVAADAVYVVTPSGVLAGVVASSALLRAPDHLTLGRFARPAPVTVPAAMPLAAAATLIAWEESAMLPVVDRGSRLLGVLRRAGLSAALARRRTASESSTGPALAGTVAWTYWTAISSLATAAVALLPPARPVEEAPR
jgi:magnesium transporter